MSVRIRFLCLFFLFIVFNGYAQDGVHIIQKGETLYSIARSYGADVQDLLKLNGITDPRKVQAGQRIKIPGGRASRFGASPEVPAGGDAARPAGFTEYKVVRGDTLFSLSRRFSIPVQAIRRANGLKDDYILKTGDLLKIPRNGEGQGTTAMAVNPPASVPAVPPAPNKPAGAAAPLPPQTARPEAALQGLLWPVKAKEVSYMTGKLYGVALLGEKSESIISLTQGTILSAGPYRGFGKVAIVQMTGGYLYVYSGCESLSVKAGDQVAPGTELGRLGIDGVSSKPQLFLMVYRNSVPIDPAKAPRA
ncbi:MAG: M23 family metallopeptidase [Treponema sp.]|jgi:murein DD-endopeptidase MepM/ murein hydrolase activator NlpD|nr:M23 family metallopeptidase [Treponema sp.]